MSSLFISNVFRKRARNTQAGFTLIELIVVVTIVGILASIAIPSYTEYVRRNNRASAQALLSQLASRQQQYLLNQRQYGTLAQLGGVVQEGGAQHYTITVATAQPANAAPTFTLTATPTGGQAADRCGTLTLNQAGEKTAASTGCW